MLELKIIYQINQDQKQLIAKCTLYVSIYLLCIQKVRNSTVVIKIETDERVHRTLWIHR